MPRSPRASLLLVTLLLAGCSGQGGVRPGAGPLSPPARRGLVLVIGDGMGPGQVSLLVSARPEGGLATLLRQGTVGLVDPAPFGGLVTDSAAGATALATGVRSRPRMLSVGPRGERLETLLEAAARAGLATGVVTTSDLTDATPAAFLAHQVDRGEPVDIAAQILATPPTVAIGGGARWFPRPPTGLQALAAEDLPYRLRSDRPSLAELTARALRVLEADPRGFVLVVEAALIDSACHEHLAPELLAELLDLDEALAALRPRAQAGELLVVVTADHETGGFGLRNRPLAGPAVPVALPSGQAYLPRADFGSRADLEALARGETPASVTWSTEGHTAAWVPLVSLGPGAPAFAGFHAQEEVGRLLRAALGLR